MSDRIHCSECEHLRPFPELLKLDRDDVQGAAEQAKEMVRRSNNSGQCALTAKRKPHGMVRGDQWCPEGELRVEGTPDSDVNVFATDPLELPAPVEPPA